MSNIMKAELFRLRHSGNRLVYMIVMCVLPVALQFFGDYGLSVDAVTFFSHSSIGFSISICMITAMVCEPFDSRAVHYEIMKGTPAMHMIMNRILITLFFSTLLYFLPTVILLIIFDGANITLSMILLLYVCFVKLTVFFVSMCVIFGSQSAVIIAFFIFMFQSTPLVLMQNVLGINVVPLTAYLTSTQVMIIGQEAMMNMKDMVMPLDMSHTALKVMISFVVFSAAMIYAAYKVLSERRQLSVSL